MSTYDYTFDCAALNALLGPGVSWAAPVLVTHWQGTEAVSRPYRFEVTFAVSQADLALETLLDKKATLTAKVPDGGTRQWHGIITFASEAGSDDTHHYYQVVLEPRLARLRNMQWSDIYLKRDLADLIKQLLKHASLTDPYSTDSAPYDYRIAAIQLARTQTEFTCQYEETCLDFLMRKLEYYGVYFWFEQGSDRESVVFANDVTQQPAEADTAIYYPKGTLDPDARRIAIVRLNRQVGLPPKTVVLHGFQEHGNTTLTLSSQADVPLPPSEQGLGEIHSVDDHFEQVEGDTNVSGATLARWRAQEMACRRLRSKGEATTPGIRAGRFLDVSEYHRGAAPRQYYVIEVVHEGVQAVETAPRIGADAYRASFVALPRWLDPAKPSEPLQFRPAQTTPVPQVTRLLNGFVDVANPNQPKRFAQPDVHGRYKVRFLFARRRYEGDHNSAFVRMATPYAGGASVQGLSNAGMHFPLREGTEVLLAFLRGDPDRPVIVGALPNIEAPSPVTADNAAHHVISTPGGNALVLADADPGGDAAPRVNFSSSVDNSAINLGTSDQAGVANGFNLRTDGHGQINANGSMLIEVPGHYRMAINPAGLSDAHKNMLNSTQNLGPGINLNQNAGIVISNYLGANIASVEGLTVNHFFGARSNLTEAVMFDTTLGAKMTVEATIAKTINLTNKHVTEDSSTRIGAVKEWIVGKWNGVLVSKTEKAGSFTSTALENYTVHSPIVSLGSPTTFLDLGPTDASLHGLANAEMVGATAVVQGAQTASLIGGISAVDVTTQSVSVNTSSFQVNALNGVTITTTGQALLNGDVILVG